MTTEGCELRARAKQTYDREYVKVLFVYEFQN